jgi:hypothetical protein
LVKNLRCFRLTGSQEAVSFLFPAVNLPVQCEKGDPDRQETYQKDFVQAHKGFYLKEGFLDTD